MKIRLKNSVKNLQHIFEIVNQTKSYFYQKDSILNQNVQNKEITKKYEEGKDNHSYLNSTLNNKRNYYDKKENNIKNVYNNTEVETDKLLDNQKQLYKTNSSINVSDKKKHYI